MYVGFLLSSTPSTSSTLHGCFMTGVGAHLQELTAVDEWSNVDTSLYISILEMRTTLFSSLGSSRMFYGKHHGTDVKQSNSGIIP